MKSNITDINGVFTEGIRLSQKAEIIRPDLQN